MSLCCSSYMVSTFIIRTLRYYSKLLKIPGMIFLTFLAYLYLVLMLPLPLQNVLFWSLSVSYEFLLIAKCDILGKRNEDTEDFSMRFVFIWLESGCLCYLL